jgi:hypothetical protein
MSSRSRPIYGFGHAEQVAGKVRARGALVRAP